MQKKISTSERGKTVTEYIDLQGLVIQKETEVSADTILITAYCFSIFDNLAYVIPPNAYKLFTSARAFMFDTEADSKEGLYVYKHDRKGQQIQKRIPGQTDFEITIFDKLYRKVLSRDAQDDQVLDAFGRSRFKFQKYDAIDRPVMSGLTFLLQGYDRQTLQTDFDNHTIINESRVSSGGLFGYANTSFPSNYTPIESSVRLVNYFDNYTWQNDALFNFDGTKAFGIRWTESYFGMATGSLVRNVEDLNWYKFVNYFDFKSRILQQFSQNHVGGIDRAEYQYRFNGEVLKMRTTTKKTGVKDIVELYEYSYNHLGNKISFTHNNNVVAKYEYDFINRLQIKKFRPSGTALGSSKTGDWNNTTTWQSGILPLGNDNVTINAGHTITLPSGQLGSAGILNDRGIFKNFGTLNMGKFVSSDLYAETFKYHIRGGLKSINTDANNNLTNTLFSMKLSYEDDGTYFDGNIRKQEWKSNLDNVTRSYLMNYDGANRILGATYIGNGTENYSMGNLSYDANGNILSLNRKGKTGSNSWGNIDQLVYIYQTNSNKIQAVNDALLVSNPNVGDFRDSSSIATQYTYNQDGSLNSDDNKKIVFEWNYLKKPKKITKANGQWKTFMYDAKGTLLQTLTSTGKKTDFVGNVTYENDVLYQIAHDEGRINALGQYEFDINDHAGNLRLTFRDSSGIAKIVTKLDYDPWGLRLKGLDYYANYQTFNKFKTFSGKQLHDDFGFNLLSYKFRYYDPALGRFISIDPLAEQYSHNSTFAFAENKLGLGIEYEGLELAPFEQMHARQVIEQNKKGMTATQAQNYESHGNKVAMVFVGGALSAGIGAATLPTTALVGATTGSAISGSLTAAGGGTKTEIMNSVVTGGIAGAITGGGSAVATKLGGSESIKVALNAASGYVAGATESAVSQKLNDGKVNSGDAVRAATVSSFFTVIGGKLGNLIDNVVNKVLTNTTIQQFGKEASNLFKEAFISKTSNDINDKIKTEKK